MEFQGLNMDAEDQKKVDTKWLQDRTKNKGLSLRGLAKLMELDHAALSRIFHGKRKVNGQELAQLANFLGTPVPELMVRFGLRETAPSASAVALVGTVGDRGEIHLNEGHGTLPPPHVPGGAVAVRNEDPMSHTFGWTYFYELRNGIDIDAINRLCVVTLKNGSQMLRIVRPGFNPNTYFLINLTTGHSESAEITSASPVIWIRT
jgi:hypothetical protein